ncbi:MAG: hypothetical protein VR72_15100 [Clostridiaceae bacterium BRH_c20a]|nr:MAG: hypothetical protein VR72_15100 [Clostridiaceae bacterium BRH_c20a]
MLEQEEKENLKTNKNDTTKFPSGKILLSVLEKEYEYEADRFRSLETRTGIFMTFVGAILVFFASTIKIPNLNVQVDSVLQALPYVLIIIFSILTILSLFISLTFFIKVVSIQTYKRLSLEGFTENNATYEEGLVSTSLMIEYKSIIKHNNEANNKKIRFYKTGVYFILISLVLTAVSYILSLFAV